jgi:hypothetical protein
VGLGRSGFAALGGSQTGAFPKGGAAGDFFGCRSVRRGDAHGSVQIVFASPEETNRFHSFHSADLHQLRERVFLYLCPRLHLFSVEIYETFRGAPGEGLV